MKKALLLAATAVSLATMDSTAHADVSTQGKQELTTIGLVTTGAFAGGPIGAVAGMVASIWVADEIGRAGERDEAIAALDSQGATLADANRRVRSLSVELAKAEQEQQRLAKAMLASLDVELMFRTGETQLSDAGEERLKTLARYLQANPDLRVQISGFADARGTQAENLQLSQARAEAVAEQLIAGGIAQNRLQVAGFGEQQAKATNGDVDAMAMERKVVIELSRTRGLANRTQP